MAPLRVAERSLDLIQRVQRAGFVEALTTDITNIDLESDDIALSVRSFTNLGFYGCVARLSALATTLSCLNCPTLSSPPPYLLYCTFDAARYTSRVRYDS